MSLWKRGRQYWIDAVVNGERYREPLGTTDWREATKLKRLRLEELGQLSPDLTNRRQSYGALDVNSAINKYAVERRSQVSPRMVAYWRENAKPLAAFLGKTKLRSLTPGHLAAYQNARIDAGRAPKTVNGELSVLRQVLKHARLWYRFKDDYKPLKNTKPPVGQAFTDKQQQRLFEIAQSKPQWLFAYVAATLSFYCGLRTCEIKGLQWKHVDWLNNTLQIRRSKTPAGWRDPSLNQACLSVLLQLRSKAAALGYAEPNHFIFPWHGKSKKLDPTRPMASWRSAWESLRVAAGLPHIRFHDGRHTALTRLAENGQPDWVIQAQLGHVSPAMMRTYSHIRRKTLDKAAAALEPSFELEGTEVTSQSTSQSGESEGEMSENAKENGSSGKTRTYNPPVNSRMLCQLSY